MEEWAMWALVATIGGGAGLAAAGLLYAYLRSHPRGSPAMLRAGDDLRRGGAAFLRSGARLAAPAAAVSCGLLLWQVGPAEAAACAWGTLLAALAVAAALEAAGQAGARVVQAAREAGRGEARATALTAGAVGGLAMASLALLGGAGVHLLAGPQSPSEMAAFVLGASVIAVFARVGGGILAKAGEASVDLLARVEPALPRGELGNPSVLADRVGEMAADNAGSTADLFESFAGALAAAAVLSLPGNSEAVGARLSFALFVATAGLLGSAAGLLPLMLLPRWTRALPARYASSIPVAATIFGAYALAHRLPLPPGAAFAASLGAVAAPAMAAATRYYASRRPVQRVAEASQMGSASTVIAGLAAGLEGCAVPVLILAAALLAAAHAAGPYGAGLCAVGMAATMSFYGSVQSSSPIAAHSRSVAATAGLGTSVSDVVEALDAEGLERAALGRGLTAGAAVLACLAMLMAYSSASGLGGVDLGHPNSLIGLLIGAIVPFVVSSLAMTAVGDAAIELVSAMRRGLRDSEADGATALGIVSDFAGAALRKAIVPGLTAVAVPLTVGLTLGAEALAAALAGAVATGGLLAFVFADAGDVWRGSRRWFEKGALGGVSSDAYAAARVGDAVGEPLKDAAGPAVHTLLKGMAAVSLVLAPLLPKM